MILPETLLTQARERGLVIMAGAGISAAAPSSLPDWYGLNEAIVATLCERVEEYLDKKDYTQEIKAIVSRRRRDNQFPPDYQAQILEENSGDDYFRALQALDVSTINSGHFGIAQLAKHGVVRAIVTTNFDRLIEKALDAAGVSYEVSYDPASYQHCKEVLFQREESPLQVIKLHGSVQDHLSMIDTLKQRLRGRNEALQEIVDLLLESYPWLYLGFSAADLEADSDYLNIIPSAPQSLGLLYVQWPGSENLSVGASRMVEAYGEKATVVKSELSDLLPELGETLELPPWGEPPHTEVNTAKEVKAGLTNWAAELNPSDAITGLAGVVEAIGETSVAFEILHRFWNRVIPKDRQGPAFARYRLMHGRLGMGTGIMSLAEDLNLNRGMESIQNLLRVGKEHPRAYAWAALAELWAGRVNEALVSLAQTRPVYEAEDVGAEHKIDVWLAFAELFFLTGNEGVEEHIKSWGAFDHLSDQAGDLPRRARVAAAAALLLAEFMPSVYPDFIADYAKPIFNHARRLNDSSINGFELLAAGRYATKQRDTTGAQSALSLAISNLTSAGRWPWVRYAQIEYVKALMDAGRLNECVELLDYLNEHIDRYQVLLPWYQEARGQYHQIIGREDIAKQAFELAVEYAEKMGLKRRAEVYRQYLQ